MTAPAGTAQEKITAYWNESAARANGTPHRTMRDEPERSAWLDALRGLLPPAPADVVDLGTGTGLLAFRCAELGHRVIGFDLSEGMLAGRHLSYTGPMPQPPDFRIGDAGDPPLPPSSVDVVATCNVLWTLLDPVKAFQNWRTVLRPGGRVLAIHMGTPGRNQGRGAETYTEDVVARLAPIRWCPSLDPAREYAEQTGYTDITVTRLDRIERFYRERDSRENVWLALTALKPAA